MISLLLMLLAACPDCESSPGYAPVTVLASEIDETPGFFVVSLSDLPADWHTAMSTAGDTDGESIRVSYLNNEIPCYPMGINTTTDTGSIFILGNNISASSDVIFKVFVGDSSLTFPGHREAVFSNYAQAYFPGESTDDFTSGNRDLTSNNTPTTTDSNQEGILAAEYNGTNQYHDYTGTQAVTDWPLTLEALTFSDVDTDYYTIASLGNTGNLNNFFILRYSDLSNTPRFGASARGNSLTEGVAVTTTNYSPSTWYYAAGWRDTDIGGNTVFLDGGSKGVDGTSVSALTSFNTFSIGVFKRSNLTHYLNGRVTFVGISDHVRSDDYISTMDKVWGRTVYSVGSWATDYSDETLSPNFLVFFR